MNKKIKLILSMVGLGILATAGTYAYIQAQSPYNDEYMENLEIIVKNREIRGLKRKSHSWIINIDIPEPLILEKWDAKHIMPQIQFYSTSRMGNKNGDFFTMNMNGSDVRLLFTREEIGGVPERRGTSRPSRSPNGRFIITAVQQDAFNFTCALFDLKKREVKNLGDGRCFNFDWEKDSNGIYFVGGDNWSQPFYFDVAHDELKDLVPSNRSELADLNYEDDIVGGRRSADGKYFIRQLKHDVINNSPELGRHVIFKLPEMKYISRENVFPKECNDGQQISADGQYFTCVFSKDGNHYYRLDEPQLSLGNAIEPWIIQASRWYMLDNTNAILRVSQNSDDSPLEDLLYIYKSRNSDYEIGPLSYFIPESLINKSDNINLYQYFPPMPNETLYQEALNNVLKRENSHD
ncbi:hypothetical protein L4174_017125 [Photobacterium sp. CCB-ST2H9]|uniref:hypothetical protein n=1 Tax=Photobacterium sp. CCB-ST2H9 TaxID=2912855 RepID=UPI002002D63A|nr:hypothetical protein [Photobacterium sp. CCB-ST2H9]UTM59794.1 hypothetical protein L4174_017125 [Photobacterium sp. CCB-ST2H9]